MIDELDAATELLASVRTDRLDDGALERAAVAGARAARRIVWSVRVAWLAAAAALLGASWIGIVALHAPEPDLAREIRLPSGSTVQLAPNAIASARAGLREEHVEVERGEVRFRVEPVEPGAVFRASTPLLTVRVIGTAFRLRVGPQSAELWVTEGVVRARSRAGEVRRLAAGSRARVGGDGHFERELAKEERAGASTPAIVSTPVSPPDPVTPVHAPIARPEEGRREEAPTQPGFPEPSGSSAAPAVRDPIEEARDLLRQRRYAEAEAAARRAGDSVDARFVLADALRGEGRVGEAANEYRRIANGSDRAAENALYALARLHLERRGAPERAVALAEEHRRRFPAGALEEEFAITRYEALARAGRPAEARAAVEDYLARFPNGTRAAEARRMRERMEEGR